VKYFAGKFLARKLKIVKMFGLKVCRAKKIRCESCNGPKFLGLNAGMPENFGTLKKIPAGKDPGNSCNPLYAIPAPSRALIRGGFVT